MKAKYLPNLITILRIIGSIYLFFLKPLTITFFIVYGLCIVSDVLDGYIARKCSACTKFGEVLDSSADTIFFIVIVVRFLSLRKLENYFIYWIIAICIIKVLSFLAGFIKYKKAAFLHTYANKFTGVIISLSFPLIYILGGITKTLIILCAISTIAAMEELLINLISKKLNRNVHSIFKELS